MRKFYPRLENVEKGDCEGCDFIVDAHGSKDIAVNSICNLDIVANGNEGRYFITDANRSVDIVPNSNCKCRNRREQQGPL